MNKALGLIEVIGYVAAIEAADAAEKAADVALIGVEKVTGGIVTVKLVGDVAAVKAAVDAGALAADSIGTLRAAHVIPRLHQEAMILIEKQKIETSEKIEAHVEPKSQEAESILTDELEQQVINQQIEDQEQEVVQQEAALDENSLMAMNVVELKELIKSLSLPMTTKKLKAAKKDELVSILLRFYMEGDK